MMIVKQKTMNRRHALKSMLVASGSLVVLPSWARSWTVHDVAIHKTSFPVTEQQILASVADTIIPAGDSIGALSVGVDKFLLKLIDACYERDVQDNVKTQLNALDATAQATHQKSFTQCNQLQRQSLLMRLSASSVKSEADFFDLMKSETIRGFTTSQEVMVKYYHYKVAPGHYYGCVDLKS